MMFAAERVVPSLYKRITIIPSDQKTKVKQSVKTQTWQSAVETKEQQNTPHVSLSSYQACNLKRMSFSVLDMDELFDLLIFFTAWFNGFRCED